MRTIKIRLLWSSSGHGSFESLQRVVADLFDGTVLVRDEGNSVGYFLEIPAEKYMQATEYLASKRLLHPRQTGL